MTHTPPHNHQAIQDLAHLIACTPENLRSLVAAQVKAHSASLATVFYQSMLGLPAAAEFLDHGTVKTRLHGSMMRWLESLYAHPHIDLEALIAQQRHVGQVHARIHLPYHLVARGARLLKWSLAEKLKPELRDSVEVMQIMRFVGQLMDTVLEVMSASYEQDAERESRSDEAFRQHAIGQNMAAERERQRSNLLEWGQAVLLSVYRQAGAVHLPRISASEFGLWIVHKGSSMFEGSSELAEILISMERLDQTLLPQLKDPTLERQVWMELLTGLESELEAIKFQLTSLFDRHQEVENGRDALTRLLNRRFLPSVISREIQIGNKKRCRFALLLIDIDFFKRVNDTHGHEAGDMVLQQVATLLQNTMRSGDSVFRYGGEELLVLMVESTPELAMQVAEKIRARIAGNPFLIGNDQALSVTVSIGVSIFDGHPDYQYLIRRADEALYRAKNSGRNQVCLA